MENATSKNNPDNSADHKDAFMALAATLIGSLVPMWLGYIIYQAFAQWKGEWAVFYKNGEFYLYSASFLASAAFIFYKNKRKHYDFHSWMLLIMILVVACAAILFALLRVSQDVFQSGPKFGEPFLKWTSSTMFFYSIAMCYWSLVLQNRGEPDLRENQAKQVEGLSEAFDKLR